MSTTITKVTSRSSREHGVARQARRLVALERHYACTACGHEYRSWSRVRACPDCGELLPMAVIRRAAVADAA
jgi:predicted RNA-binding Zn-ribbon protein involved in translation (DUF1610 family)